MHRFALLALGFGAWASAGLCHSIAIDGDASDWVGTPPAQIHDTALSAGEWIYRGEADDARGDPPGNIADNADITEVRLTADATNLYILVRVKDVTVITEPYVALGIEFTNNPADTAIQFLGDESGMGYPSASAYPEYNIVIHNPTAPATEVELFHDNGSGFWYAPPSGWDAFINPNSGFDLIEARVPLADINLIANPVFRVSLATFDNDSNGSGGVGYNNDVDATQDYPDADGPPGGYDALDCMGGTVGVSQAAWDRDIGDGDIDYAFTVNLGTIPAELSVFSAE